MRPFVFVALAAATLSPPESAGQNSPIVTEAEFLLHLAQRHPAHAALTAQLEAARAGVTRARTLDNPELAFVREAPSGSAEQYEIVASWRPPRPGRRRKGVEAAEAGVRATESRLATKRLALRLAAREAFAEWALSAERARRLRARHPHLAKLAEAAGRRAESGEASGLEARRLTLALAEAGVELALAEAALARARSTALAWRPALPAATEPRLPELPPIPAAEAAVHPRVSALAAEREGSRALEEYFGRSVELPELSVGWQRQSLDGAVFEGPIVGLNWSIPLFARGQAARAEAEARSAVLSSQLALTRRELDATRKGASAAYAQLAESTARTARMTAGTEVVIRGAVAAFRVGEADLTDLLETLRSVTAAELAALDLHGEALAAHRELEKAVGRPLALGREPADRGGQGGVR